MTKQILKELESFMFTDEVGNKVVKEDDLTALMCQHALSPDAMGRVHEALELLRIEVLPYGEEGDIEKYQEIIKAFAGANSSMVNAMEALNPQQKQRVIDEIENLVPKLLLYREELQGKLAMNREPTWNDYFSTDKIERIRAEGSGDKSTITSAMRDYIWALIKKHRGRIHSGELADTISQDTGMNRGSAFIYVSLIANWLKGQENTRTMKFEDLVFYVGRIKDECSSIEYENTLDSLRNSISYWEDKVAGNFARKVADLLNNIKSGYPVNHVLRSGDGKDRTKYHFNGRVYNKKGLVLAVVQMYVAQNPSTTISQLSYIFPDNLQGSRGVFREENTAKHECRDYSIRYFAQPDEIINLSDGNVLVCTQWGRDNLPNFIEKAKKLGFQIVAVNQ